MTKQEYKDQIGEQLDNENRGGNRNAVTGD